MREAGVGEGIHDAADERGQTVGADGSLDILAADTLLDDLARGEDVTGGLHHRDDHDDDHGEDRDHIKARGPEIKRGSDAKRAGLAHLIEGGIAQDQGDGGA